MGFLGFDFDSVVQFRLFDTGEILEVDYGWFRKRPSYYFKMALRHMKDERYNFPRRCAMVSNCSICIDGREYGAIRVSDYTVCYVWFEPDYHTCIVNRRGEK